MKMIYEVKTEKSFEVAREDLKKSLGARSFGVLWEMNFKDKLHEKGLEFEDDFQVMEVCNPPKAKKVLDKHREAGYMLPCKMAVYTEEGQVYMGMMKPTALMGVMEKEDLRDVAEEVEAILKEALSEAR
ncbi:DUF302 domain-containing protein [Proteiniclasticum sp. BAD-10]|uniref:DUF302 domain-containing protein n=1 Tax=Proteiniclasticum sediminis TaxID=2804028 RepID=A0A941CNX9_9CLOT|nr:DUF302 domain-containing protein [Proteiniclasticum sediminis]MBR0576082.1 DUF302 domain-containing protein [Proteiniclasticum sediminis]